MSTQTSLIPLADVADNELIDALLCRLSDGAWHHREELARGLEISVRAIRDAASHAEGRIISGNRGLKLTVFATGAEMQECTGRFRSQIREMERRLRETESIWVG